jgi:hypothetical protein
MHSWDSTCPTASCPDHQPPPRDETASAPAQYIDPLHAECCKARGIQGRRNTRRAHKTAGKYHKRRRHGDTGLPGVSEAARIATPTLQPHPTPSGHDG